MSLARNPEFFLLLTALLTCTSISCSSSPKRVTQPSIDASRAGSQAMEMYDTNHDGIVSGEELEHAPALKAAMQRLDTNGDKGVSADEVAARVAEWKRQGIGLINFSFRVTLDGSPLGGATVTFEPEAFLGTEVKPASCVTNANGDGGATIAKEDRPDPKSPPGMNLALYKVKFSKMVNGKETIPAKYNSATIVGQEAAADVPDIVSHTVTYALTSK
jgi:hypothetical protein